MASSNDREKLYQANSAGDSNIQDETAETSELDLPPEEFVIKTSPKRPCYILLGVFYTLLFIAALTVLFIMVFMINKNIRPTVDITCGPVEGSTSDGVYVFKGIPFAQPPVGDRRWRPPVALSKNTGGCWNSTFQAKSFGNQCPQRSPDTHQFVGYEDCLYLNVYTPTLDTDAKLPVMVYIHGGFLQFCNGSMPGYAPDERIVKVSNMVHVSIQYRLNALGFLVLDILPNRTGNYGFLDQIMALQWVRDNIRGFGGDPGQVTIYGQSSGGTSVWALMMSPLAKGLFHKAWMQSSSPILNKTITDAMKDNEFFKEKTNCTTTECLYNLSAKEIVETVQEPWTFKDASDLPQKGFFEKALAVVDGHVIPEAPFDSWDKKTGSYSDVPLIVGTTAQEADFDPAPGLQLKNWTQSQLNQYVADRLDAFGNNITNMTLALYPWEQDAEYVFTSMTSDLRVSCGNDILAEKAVAALSSPVYRYVITNYPSKPVRPLGNPFPSKYAFHGWDLFAFLDVLDIWMVPEHLDITFGETLRQNIFHFVKNGVPSDRNWLPVGNMTALISTNITYTDRYNREQCDFWTKNGFFSYAWIN